MAIIEGVRSWTDKLLGATPAGGPVRVTPENRNDPTDTLCLELPAATDTAPSRLEHEPSQVALSGTPDETGDSSPPLFLTDLEAGLPTLPKEQVMSDAWKGKIRALLYVVQFDRDPTQGMDRVLEHVVDAGALGASPADYLEAIGQALSSSERLSELLPLQHSEEVTRDFLTALGRHLEDRGLVAGKTMPGR